MGWLSGSDDKVATLACVARFERKVDPIMAHLQIAIAGWYQFGTLDPLQRPTFRLGRRAS
jgi:hypothetical protein